jgi:hypothetical protein
VRRATTWYRLEPGTRVESGDVVDAAERGYVQAELAGGGTLGIVGPALAHMAALPLAADKTGPAEIALMRGWFKVADAAKARPVLLRLPTAALRLSDGVVVVHDDPAQAELFVERGRTSVLAAAARGKELAHEAGEGEYLHHGADRAFITEDRPSPAFIAAMPRELRDALPALAGRFASAAPPALAAGREVTFVEAELWLSGASRKVFVRRFTPRLADPAFRAAAAARPIPEWDRALHPEKYRPRSDAGD